MNSKRGIQFRVWATRFLREHLLRGYTLDRRLLESKARELEAALGRVLRAAGGEEISTDQGRGLVDIIGAYACCTQASARSCDTAVGSHDVVSARIDGEVRLASQARQMRFF